MAASRYFCSMVSPNNNIMLIRTFLSVACLVAVVGCQQNASITLPTANAAVLPASLPSKINQAPERSGILLQSTDGGTTWQDLTATLPEYVNFPMVCAKDNRVYLGSGGQLYEGTGAPLELAWTKKETNLDTDISNVFFGKSGPYLSIYGVGIYKEMLQGSGVWMPFYGNLPDKSIRSLIERPNGDLFVATESGVYCSKNGGAQWAHVLVKSQISGLIEHNGNLIATYYQGIARSTDGGSNWEHVLQAPKCFPYRMGHFGNGLITLIEEQQDDYKKNTSRIATSNDDGKTWQSLDKIIDPQWRSGDLKQSGKYLFLGHNKGISRSADGGKTWELVHPLHLEGSYNLVVDGDIVYAVHFVGC